MPVIGYDHVALPARAPEALIAFYKKLGFGTIHALGFSSSGAARSAMRSRGSGSWR